MIASHFLYASLVGVIPALLWLWFWLREDVARPEPKRFLAFSFVAGMLAAPLAILAQSATKDWFPDNGIIFYGTFISFSVIIWVAVEELVKFVASFLALRSKADDEPIDPMIYLITSALGFVAVENTLYGLQALHNKGLHEFLEIGVARFVGPSMLHIVSSGLVGLSISLSFYIHGTRKRIYLYCGLFTAILLHTLYNFLIIKGSETNTFTTIAFTSTWVLTIVLMLAFEIVKKIKRT